MFSATLWRIHCGWKNDLYWLLLPLNIITFEKNDENKNQNAVYNVFNGTEYKFPLISHVFVDKTLWPCLCTSTVFARDWRRCRSYRRLTVNIVFNAKLIYNVDTKQTCMCTVFMSVVWKRIKTKCVIWKKTDIVT